MKPPSDNPFCGAKTYQVPKAGGKYYKTTLAWSVLLNMVTLTWYAGGHPLKRIDGGATVAATADAETADAADDDALVHREKRWTPTLVIMF